MKKYPAQNQYVTNINYNHYQESSIFVKKDATYQELSSSFHFKNINKYKIIFLCKLNNFQKIKINNFSQ